MSLQDQEPREPISFERAAVICLCAIFATGLTSLVIVYMGTPYTVDKANAYLNSALVTNDPEKKIEVMTTSLKMLQGIKGNSGWFAPDIKTDIDETKTLLASVITETSKQLPSLDNGQDNDIVVKGMSHKDMNEYINQQVDAISHRIDQYSGGYMFNPMMSPLLYIVFIGIPGAFVLPMVIAKYDRERFRREEREYYNRQRSRV